MDNGRRAAIFVGGTTQLRGVAAEPATGHTMSRSISTATAREQFDVDDNPVCHQAKGGPLFVNQGFDLGCFVL